MIRAALIALGLLAVASAAHAQRVPRGFEAPRESPTPEQIEAAGEPLTNVIWIEQPDGRDYARAYPVAAQGRQNGTVLINCIVQSDGRVACAAQDDGVEAYNFEWATLLIATKFRVGLQTRDGLPTEGRLIRRTIRWISADDRRGPSVGNTW